MKNIIPWSAAFKILICFDLFIELALLFEELNEGVKGGKSPKDVKLYLVVELSLLFEGFAEVHLLKLKWILALNKQILVK